MDDAVYDRQFVGKRVGWVQPTILGLWPLCTYMLIVDGLHPSFYIAEAIPCKVAG
jgi:hypothetical protein